MQKMMLCNYQFIISRASVFSRNLIPSSFPFSSSTQCRSKGNITGGARERRRREPLGGSGGMLPQKILKARGLEMLFPAFSKSDM